MRVNKPYQPEMEDCGSIHRQDECTNILSLPSILCVQIPDPRQTSIHGLPYRSSTIVREVISECHYKAAILY